MNMLPVYRAATTLGSPALRWWLKRRVRQGKEDAERLGERFGHTSIARPAGPLVWMHGASVGESLSLLPLIDALRQRDPDLNIMVTTGTATSAHILAGRLPEGVLHQFNPADSPRWVARFLDTWQPDLALYVESELWPAMLSLTQARGIPTGLLNARMSDSSYRTWQRLPGLIRPLMGEFRFCLAQNPTQAERMAALGARNPKPLGNLKFAAKPLAADEAELARLREEFGTRPRWLAASTHPGEEAIAAEVHASLKAAHPELLTIVAVRHPERGDSVARELRGRGLKVVRRSRGETIQPESDVYLADTLGEMGLFYRLAEIAFVGGSMGELGGHNPIEPAQLGCAVLHGPDMRNFSEVAEDLAEAGGSWQVRDAAGLARALGRLLAEPDTREHQAGAAKQVADAQADMLDKVLAELEPFLAPLRGQARVA
ncbi:3-deoxy-D-manno-octulosonic acid transferase [Ferruginivarius sediminum]|uniref:3-deoxy-D-manno-octulosonic acid transferase n=1 Tax=Ferruginivarius sediminum TaxID=2661937 RepID=A0A369TCV7_9PROT|nr:3-deoxy-D-manno-octulosonic acid transferase [Ferruginivarius sediminum]RDD62364.1 3-deoxy-D-manno-octulosonic acid transferase [Ferruginivarius sediminum]